MLEKAGSGHTAGPLGMADVFAVLYFETLNINPQNYKSDSRDYLFLSNGHICPVQYAALAEAGFFKKSELLFLRKFNSRLQGHPHNGALPGIENSGGPLAQGLSMAVGAALALKADKKENRVFATCGDGELDEGQIWEAFMLASKYKLDNLIVIIDKNGIQLDGPTKEIMDLDNIYAKLKAFGFEVLECNGNDVTQVSATLSLAKKRKGYPIAIIANTIPGKGVSFMENDYHWHGKAPNAEEAKKALEELSKND